MPRTRAASPVPSVTSSTERLGSRHAEEDPRSDRAFCTAMVGIVDGRAVRWYCGPAARHTPVPGSRGQWQKQGFDTRTVQRRDTPNHRFAEQKVFVSKQLSFSLPGPWPGGEPIPGIPTPTLHVFVYSVTARDLRLPSVSAGRFAPWWRLLHRWRWWEARKRGGWLNDEHSATRWIGSGHGDQTL